MKKTNIALLCLVLALFATACGGGSGGDSDATAPDDPGSSDALVTQAPDDATPDVDKAGKGLVNRPKSGAYVYAYSTKTTNSAVPDSTPRSSKAGAELTSTVSSKEDITTTKDKSTEGSAVSTMRQRWTDDAVLDLSARLESSQGSSSCTYEPPLESIRIPFKEETFPKQKLSGKGQSCVGERTITVAEQDTVKDARGVSWPVWIIKIETVVKQPGLTKNGTDTRWFSPDLGKDVKIEGIAEYINADGEVAVRAEQTSLLKRYPTT